MVRTIVFNITAGGNTVSICVIDLIKAFFDKISRNMQFIRETNETVCFIRAVRAV